MAIKTPKSTKGKGWVGQWCDGTIGWFSPEFVHNKSQADVATRADLYADGERFFLCEIFIQPLKNSKGRPITKFIRKKEDNNK